VPKTRIAVEEGLTPVRERLEAAGYEVVPLGAGVRGVAALVVNGMDANVSGEQRLAVAAPVIDAAGQSPEQVLARVRRLPAGTEAGSRP
jgi:hypothetical protein